MLQPVREFAAKAHKNQLYDGMPYVEAHLDKVVITTLRFSRDPVVVAMAYLHDTREDTKTSYSDIEVRFGKTVADGVEALTDQKGKTRFERQMLTYVRLRDNKNALLVKLCDRITNMAASFGTKHSFHYVNEYERFKGSLYSEDSMYKKPWEELDKLYEDLKRHMRENNEVYVKLSSG